MAINREEIDGESGAFLVENTLQLFKFFIEKNRSLNKSQFGQKVQQIIVPEISAMEFINVLENVKSQLESYIDNLKNREIWTYDRVALQVVISPTFLPAAFLKYYCYCRIDSTITLSVLVSYCKMVCLNCLKGMYCHLPGCSCVNDVKSTWHQYTRAK